MKNLKTCIAVLLNVGCCMAKPQRPNVNSGLNTSQNKEVTSANIVGQRREVNSDPEKING
jgi:hypothetical protein